MRQRVDTIIVSDVHLGSPISRAGDLQRTLAAYQCHRLILLGDIFHDLTDTARLSVGQWELLGYLRTLSCEKIWVEGNHDVGVTDVMAPFIGVPMRSEYLWSFQGETYAATHGHRFDPRGINIGWLSAVGSWFFLTLQRYDPTRGKRLCNMVDGVYTAGLRLSEAVEQGALQYARAHQARYVFCGHTHEARRVTRDGVTYINTGSWTVKPRPATYVTITPDYGVELHAVR
jgi:UDP-2,3-diacylglucosamine pyrophosphatase LpxH